MAKRTTTTAFKLGCLLPALLVPENELSSTAFAVPKPQHRQLREMRMAPQDYDDGEFDLNNARNVANAWLPQQSQSEPPSNARDVARSWMPQQVWDDNGEENDIVAVAKEAAMNYESDTGVPGSKNAAKDAAKSFFPPKGSTSGVNGASKRNPFSAPAGDQPKPGNPFAQNNGVASNNFPLKNNNLQSNGEEAAFSQSRPTLNKKDFFYGSPTKVNNNFPATEASNPNGGQFNGGSAPTSFTNSQLAKTRADLNSLRKAPPFFTSPPPPNGATNTAAVNTKNKEPKPIPFFMGKNAGPSDEVKTAPQQESPFTPRPPTQPVPFGKQKTPFNQRPPSQIAPFGSTFSSPNGLSQDTMAIDTPRSSEAQDAMATDYSLDVPFERSYYNVEALPQDYNADDLSMEGDYPQEENAYPVVDEQKRKWDRMVNKAAVAAVTYAVPVTAATIYGITQGPGIVDGVSDAWYQFGTWTEGSGVVTPQNHMTSYMDRVNQPWTDPSYANSKWKAPNVMNPGRESIADATTSQGAAQQEAEDMESPMQTQEQTIEATGDTGTAASEEPQLYSYEENIRQRMEQEAGQGAEQQQQEQQTQSPDYEPESQPAAALQQPSYADNQWNRVFTQQTAPAETQPQVAKDTGKAPTYADNQWNRVFTQQQPPVQSQAAPSAPVEQNIPSAADRMWERMHLGQQQEPQATAPEAVASEMENGAADGSSWAQSQPEQQAPEGQAQDNSYQQEPAETDSSMWTQPEQQASTENVAPETSTWAQAQPEYEAPTESADDGSMWGQAQAEQEVPAAAEMEMAPVSWAASQEGYFIPTDNSLF